MSHFTKISFIFLLMLGTLNAQKADMFDGPYIDSVKDSFRIRWIQSGVPKDSTVHSKTAGVFSNFGLPEVDLSKLEIFEEKEWEFPTVEKFVVLGDPHGQYDKVKDLLAINKVIDSLGNWSFGNNHLVVMGDYFGRGDKVLETLWLLFKLEQQAVAANGHVHILLGNHDIMTLDKDLRYLNKKYLYTSGAFKTEYPQLFSENSVLGKWLRSKNIAITIDDFLFIHGGFSMDLVHANLDIEQINELGKKSIFQKLSKEAKYSDTENLLLGDSGPFWYRGYSDSTYITESIIDSVLAFNNVQHVVVGHTIMKEIKHKYDGKLIFVDCGLFDGNQGELLKYSDGELSKLTHKGDKKKILKSDKPKKTTIFDYIYNLDPSASLSINADLGRIIKTKLKEEYQVGSLQIKSQDRTLDFGGKIRARGNMRKQVCYLPPVKFNLNKEDLSKNNLKSAEKLKLVFPCRNNGSNQEKLNQEYFIYTLYQLLDSNAMRAKLIDVNIQKEGDKKPESFKAICVEDEVAYSIRKNTQLLPEKGVITSKVLDRPSFLRMYFFQYMIANTDWSIGNRHNVLITRFIDEKKIVALPYDFDYSGFVNQTYAVPHESVPIEKVTERHFMPYGITEKEFNEVIEFYNSKKEDLLKHCQTPTYLTARQIKENISFIEDFYNDIKNPKSVKSRLKIE